tara:strand:- start:1382 stop:1627 length:246 start_codon:yes stop_codon:yes gene_type:complete
MAHNFERSIGIEYIEGLHLSALKNLNRWRKHEKRLASEDGSTVYGTKFEFVMGDMSKIPSFSLSPAPYVLFCHATLFDNGE